MNKTDFKGKGEEYFRIWIVNTLLSIVTLGIYSAWAKVKNRKYLYQNLSINNHRFDYHAQPIQILKGRLIAIFTLFLVTSLGVVNPIIYVLSTIAFIFLAPWLINKSLSFNMRMTSYRNVRFDFQGDYWNTFIWIFIAPALSIITLYLALPHFLRKRDEYLISNYKFGNRSFNCSLSSSEYYKAVFSALGAVLGIGVILAILGFIFATVIANGEILNILLIVLGYILSIATFASVYGAVIRNHQFNNSKIDGVADFQSTIKIGDYLVLIFTNLLMIIFSLGLAIPFVQIRTMKFLSENTLVNTQREVENIIDDISHDSSALADEVADAFDIEM